MNERTTTELIVSLGEDFERCHQLVLDAIEDGKAEDGYYVNRDYEFHARNLIRSGLSLIEAATFSIKVQSANKCIEKGIPISDHERFLSIEIDADIDDKGQVVERPAKIRLTSNIRFAFGLLERASGTKTTFDPQLDWWSFLRKTIRVRDRLTHPRMPEDIDIGGEEVVDALKAVEGFEKVVAQSFRENA
ncbi:hypothetical protein [Litorivivens sp.]|uniref:hypothetical protein n=1 Tax=Litorivivens sp. TaxID=2020868 RepID=UPI0035669B80